MHTNILTGKGNCARTGSRSQGACRDTFVNPCILFGGLHNHQKLPAVRAAYHVHPRVYVQGFLI